MIGCQKSKAVVKGNVICLFTPIRLKAEQNEKKTIHSNKAKRPKPSSSAQNPAVISCLDAQITLPLLKKLLNFEMFSSFILSS